jgi:hypothetical protein
MDIATIVCSPEEKHVKTYKCTQMIFPKCIGYLSVTNKRLIYHSHSRDSRIVDEVQLNTVTGIRSFYGSKINYIMLVLGIVCSLFALRNIFSLNRSWSPSLDILMALVLGVAAAAMFYFCYRKTFRLLVFSSGATGTPIAVGEGFGNLGGNSALLSLTATPTEETDQMMRELGCVVGDLQTMGDLAIERWARKKKR